MLQAWKKGLEERKWQQDIDLAERLQTHMIPFNSPYYPKRLLETANYPLSFT